MKFSKEEILKILEGAKDEQGNVPFAIAKKAIEKLKVEPEWIPVTEKLPEEHITPLPKEHGRLIDADSLLNKLDETYKSKIGLVPDCLAEGFVQCENLIKNEPTIYKGVKNENRK